MKHDQSLYMLLLARSKSNFVLFHDNETVDKFDLVAICRGVSYSVCFHFVIFQKNKARL